MPSPTTTCCKGLFGSRFVGLNNFKFLFSSGAAWTFTANTLLYNIIFIVIGTALRIAFAIMLAEMSAKFFKKTCQTLMFLPHFVSMVLVGTICFALFNSNGFINSLRLTLGMDKFYYYETPWVWYILIPIVNFWKTTGYGTVVYLSAITGISDDLYEAADLDGATFWQEIIHITLPCLRPTIVILFLMSLGNIMRGQFDLFYQLVGNVPLVRNTTEIIDTYVFRARYRDLRYQPRYGGGLVSVRGGSAAGAGLPTCWCARWSRIWRCSEKGGWSLWKCAENPIGATGCSTGSPRCWSGCSRCCACFPSCFC